MTPDIKRDLKTAALVILAALAVSLLVIGQCCVDAAETPAAKATANQPPKPDVFPPLWPSASEWPTLKLDIPETQSQCRNGQCRPEQPRFQPRRIFRWKRTK